MAPVGSRPWIPEEDRKVLGRGKLGRIANEINRTYATCLTRRHKLRHPEQFAKLDARWSAREVRILRHHYPLHGTVGLRKLLPKKSPQQCRDMARKIGLKVLLLERNDFTYDGGFELVDQVRERARADGIAYSKLDKLLDAKGYFKKEHRHAGRPLNLARVMKAVEFFGGKLVIDWCDR